MTIYKFHYSEKFSANPDPKPNASALQCPMEMDAPEFGNKRKIKLHKEAFGKLHVV